MNSRRAIFRKWYAPVLRLYFVGDIHEGAEACDESAVSELAEIIAADTYGLAVGLGDYIEAISYTDKRFDPGELSQPISPQYLDNPFYCQALRFAKLFEATRGKWLCMVAGNHEERARHYSHFDPLPVMAERLGTIYHGGSDCGGWCKIVFMGQGKHRNSIDLFVMHGVGSGELRGGDALRLQRLMGRKQADIVAMGHGHKPGAFPEQYEFIGPNGFERTQTRWGIECFPMIGKHRYIARNGGNAPPIGYAVVEIFVNNDGPANIGVALKTLGGERWDDEEVIDEE